MLIENIDLDRTISHSKDVFDALWLKWDTKGMEEDIRRTLQTRLFLGWLSIGFSKN